jgi:hypothetical protein
MNKKYLLFVFPALIALLAFAFAGCGNSEDDNTLVPGGDGNVAAGFAAMKAGSWAEYTSSDGSRERYEFLGMDSYKGSDCYLLEFDSITSGKKSTTQIWINKSTGQGVLMVMKDVNGEVTKMELTPSTPQDIPTGETPVNSTKVGTKKYTTPTGKTVDATIYQTQTTAGLSESWVSSQVPFGEVKSLFNGEVTSELYDYGTSGAVRDISKSEMESAASFGLPGGDDNGAIGNGGDGGGIGGNIIVTVGVGAKPEIKVSQPVTTLMLIGQGFTWGFSTDNDQLLPGPFKYGTIPNGARSLGIADPPDLKAGTQYIINVAGENDSVGMLIFIR